MASDYSKLKEAVDYALDAYENELGRRSSGLAYLQARKEQLFLEIQAEVDYYKSLEQRNYLLAKENNELRSKITMSMPELDFKMGAYHEASIDITYFYWQMQPMAYRTPLPHFPKCFDDKFWKMVRSESYKGFIKLFRKAFEDNFQRFAANYK